MTGIRTLKEFLRWQAKFYFLAWLVLDLQLQKIIIAAVYRQLEYMYMSYYSLYFFIAFKFLQKIQ